MSEPQDLGWGAASALAARVVAWGAPWNHCDAMVQPPAELRFALVTRRRQEDDQDSAEASGLAIAKANRFPIRHT